MQNYKRMLTSLTLAALCLLMPLNAGCKNDNDEGAANIESVYVVPVPKDRVSVDPESEDYDAGTSNVVSLGESYTYDNKVTMKMTAILEIDSQASLNRRILLCELDFTNNSDTAMPISFATHFSTFINGERDNQPVLSTANQQANKYYGNDDRLIHQELAAGESIQGTIALSVPASWDTLELVYTPFYYYSNDNIQFEILEENITHISATSVATK